VLGTLINVGTVVAGTAIGVSVGSRLPRRIQERVLAGLGMITLVIGVDLALAWGRDDTSTSTPLYVLGGVLAGGVVGEALGIERRLEALGIDVEQLAGQFDAVVLAEADVDERDVGLELLDEPAALRGRPGGADDHAALAGEQQLEAVAECLVIFDENQSERHDPTSIGRSRRNESDPVTAQTPGKPRHESARGTRRGPGRGLTCAPWRRTPRSSSASCR
jgi:hypothetical protein